MSRVSGARVGIRGQPLLVLMALLGGWVALRAALWQSPFPPLLDAHAIAGIPRARPTTARLRADPIGRSRVPAQAPWALPGPLDAPNAAPLPAPWRATTAPGEHSATLPPPVADGLSPVQRAVGQQLLLAAAFSHMELPSGIAAYFTSPKGASRAARELAANAGPDVQPAVMTIAPNRWSGDGWLLLRRDSAGGLAAGQPSYGRSQAGAVLRYRLDRASGHRPVAYTRVTRALAGPPETEVAVGLAARPIAGMPVSVAGEVRAYDGPTHRELRPAAFAVTELPPAKLPLGLRGEAYAQAGYVGGRYATAFVDGQGRVDVKVARLGSNSEVRAGAGVWGGAQKHAARLDIGLSATVGFRLGQTLSRLAVDYRWRVAGNAEPTSGPALTISAGF